ncbi:thioredoxin domain-containing protein 11 [Lycorma delicatula]|uniref:thioredoxin domain-containing protein 11 n=1 Tax=Lycorma delicatula TaxID=130591 RepID=UPI003F50F79D
MSVKPAAVTKVDGDDENVRGCKKQQSPSKMYIVGREVCFVLAIIFTTYAAVLNTNSTNSKGPPPAPFFSKSSLVTDYYSGELRKMLKKASEVELMFIMYYAPWDAESQNLRKEFEIAAEHHHKQVFFAAINCWQPGSECRSQASKIPILTYPEFIAYPSHSSPVGYEGQRLAGHMIRFINSLLSPMHRIESAADLQNLKIRYDVIVVGCVEFKNMRGGIEYKVMYEAALKLAEKDTKEIGFAVIINRIAAADIGVKAIPSISLYLWNEVREYTGAWKVDAITQWITQNVNVVAAWISPPGIKSLTFKPFIDVGAVLVMFTPENPLLSHSDAFDMLREVGFIYHNCKNNTDVCDFIHYFSVNKLKMNAKEESIYVTCQRRKKNYFNSVTDSNFYIPVQVVENVWINSSSGLKSRKRTHSVSSFCESPSATSAWSINAIPTCNAASNNHGIHSNVPKSSSKPVTSMLISDEDYRSASSLTNWRFIEKCRQYFRAISFGLPSQHYHINDVPSKQNPEFVGLDCKSNHTLSLLAMDSNIYEHFADGLGIDLSKYPEKTAVLIFNSEQESVYVMDKPITVENLQEFILNFTSGRIERHLRSEPRSSQPPNRYVQNNTSDKKSNPKPSVSLLELTSETFLTIALNESQNVMVFYHSPYCAFCHGISHIYLTIAYLLRNINNLIFARIDGENNDLPWEFTVHHYPSILFLPAFRKSESRVFPQRLPITVDNLSKFVLANLDLEARLQGMVELCGRWGTKQYLKKRHDCMLGVRHVCLNMIAETLKEYRAVSRLNILSKYRQKALQRLLKRLRYLKEIHLQLGASKLSTINDIIKEFHSTSVNSEEIVNSNYIENKIDLIKDEL